MRTLSDETDSLNEEQHLGKTTDARASTDIEIEEGKRSRSRPWGCLSTLTWLTALVLCSPVAFSLYLCPSVEPLRTAFPERTGFMAYREEAAEEKAKTWNPRYEPVPLASLPLFLPKMLVAAEDARFYDHAGFDWDALSKAWETNQKRGKVVVGGSTITQQLAKNLWLSPERSWWRKVVEAVLAFRLELTLPKDRILELYVNVIEWGDGVFGIEAAAKRYYGVSAARLTPAQAATLVAAIPAPLPFSAKNPSSRVERVRNRLLRSFGFVEPPEPSP